MNKKLSLIGWAGLIPSLFLLLLLAVSPAVIEDQAHVLPHLFTSTDYSLCVTVAALLCTLLLFLLQRLRKHPVTAPLLAASAIPFGLLGARLMFVLSRMGMYGNGLSVFTLTDGGYMLYGALVGVLPAFWLCAKEAGRPMSELLDDAAAPGLLMIALCRAAEYFTTEGRGDYVEDLPFPIAVMGEWGMAQLAVFVWEAAIALLILAAVLLLCRDGHGAFVLALVLYCCCQAVMESLREDNLPRFGFVRVSQVTSGVIVLGLTAWRALRGLSRGNAALRIGVCVLLIAGIGIAEWALDKTNLSNVIIYGLMILCSAAMGANCLLIGSGEKQCN